jgi:glycosyltransferase involved in cell wall biosynthesis
VNPECGQNTLTPLSDMHVAVDVMPGLAAGVGRMQRETVRALCAGDGPIQRVTAFSFGNRYPRPSWMPPTARYHVSPLPGRVQWLLTNRLGLPVERVRRLGRADVLLELNLRPVRAAAPVVLVVADVSWRTFREQYRTTFTDGQVQLAERAIRRADHILTLSHFSANELIQGGFPSCRITVAPLGVSEEFRVVSDADVSRVRDRYGLAGDFVLYVGGINERKNIAVLAAALQRLESAPPLVLIGPPPTEPLAFWGLDQPWVRHLGYVPDLHVPAILRAATVMVFPSKLEGFGLPLVEAMAVGTPVLASDIPVFREVAGDSACFFPPNGAEVLASLIRTALDSRAFQEEYRGRGREVAAGQTWAAYRVHLLAALERALETEAASR